MNILLFLNFYFGENVQEETSYFFDKVVPAILTGVIAVGLFKIRDWFDEYKEIKKMNIKFINLYEELKKVNKEADKVYVIFENIKKEFKNNATLGTIKSPNRFLIPSIDRIEKIDSDLIFHRLILYAKDEAKSIATYRNLFNHISIFSKNIHYSYAAYQTYQELYIEASKVLVKSIEELKIKIVFEINKGSQNKKLIEKFSECYIKYQNSEHSVLYGKEFIDSIKLLVNFNKVPDLSNEIHKLIFEFQGAFQKMESLDKEALDFANTVHITMMEQHKKLKIDEINLGEAIEIQHI